MDYPELETLTHQAQVLWDYAWQRWQTAVAELELDLAEHLQRTRQQLITTLHTGDEEEMRTYLQASLPSLSPSQWEALILSLPLARERALLSRYLAQLELSPELQQVVVRTYAWSGLPLLLDPEGQLDTATSAAVVKAILITQISSASLTWIGAFLGGRTLRQIGWQDAQIPAQTDGDPWLGLTQVGVQASQLSEFVALRIQALLNTGIGRLPPLLPYQPILELVRWLTSDPLLSISNLAEFSLVAASQERRLELLCQQLQNQQRLPSPQQLLQGIPVVLGQVDPQLRTLVAKQLLILADALDPQERSDWINQLGRQLNLYNPLQYLEGWNGQVWFSQLLERLESLQSSYPELSLWSDYQAGIRQALAQPRAMDQGEILRQTAHKLDPTLSSQTV
ncbi:MAG: hypothetical protein Q6J68_00460 [Thermostichales cyanobacterium SZTDM-1c_bins_54]